MCNPILSHLVAYSIGLVTGFIGVIAVFTYAMKRALKIRPPKLGKV